MTNPQRRVHEFTTGRLSSSKVVDRKHNLPVERRKMVVAQGRWLQFVQQFTRKEQPKC